MVVADERLDEGSLDLGEFAQSEVALTELPVGYFLVDDPGDDLLDALGRGFLVAEDGATRSLDLQYYLWYEDASGDLLAEAILRAADRGVRVRVLVDDLLSSAESDLVSAAAAAHPNVELACSGILQRFRDRVRVLFMTNGDGLARAESLDPARYAAIRKTEVSRLPRASRPRGCPLTRPGSSASRR